MWRSIATNSHFTKNLRKKLLSLQYPQSCSLQSQVFHHNCFSSSSYSSHLIHRKNFSKFNHQSFRFFSQSSSSSSSITEFDSENHDVGSSSSDGEVESQTHDVDSSQILDFSRDFDDNGDIIDPQLSGVSSVKELSADFDENGENNGAQMSSLSSVGELSVGYDENGEINGAHLSVIRPVDDLSADVNDNDENNGAQMSDSSLDAQELGDGVGTEMSDSSLDAQELGDRVGNETIDVEKLEKVLSLLQSSVDESLESSLDDLELSLNEEFMVRVFETPLVHGEHLIRFFKWASSMKEVEITTAKVVGSLSRGVCSTLKRKDVYALWDLYKEMGGESGVVSVDLLNQLISVFSGMGKGKAAFEVFNKFDELGCVPNVDTYYLTIGALCKRSFYDWAAIVSQKMLDVEMLPDSEKVGDIISFYCKGLRSKEAHAVYIAAKRKNSIPPQRAISFLISCLSKVDETVSLANEMLDDFSGETRKKAINPFSWVVRGLCRKNDIEGGKKLLLEMIEKGPPPGNAVFNTVINAFSKAGELDDAKEILKLMESRGLKPDVFSYSVIISGYTKGGMMEEACKILSAARKKHPKLCPATFHTLIRGYCKLEQFDKAVKLLSDMKKYEVEPNVDEYNKLIQSLCLKALDWKTAEKLLEEMTTKGLYLPGITRGLISAVKELEQEAVGSTVKEPEQEAVGSEEDVAEA